MFIIDAHLDRPLHTFSGGELTRASLGRAGWDIYLVHPEGRLADVWRLKRVGKLLAVGSSS